MIETALVVGMNVAMLGFLLSNHKKTSEIDGRVKLIEKNLDVVVSWKNGKHPCK